MARHDFTEEVKEQLAKRVGFHCSNPACGVATIGPSEIHGKSEYAGVAAHIYSASVSNGPRANPSLSEEERKSIDNGIHLCNKCSTIIDKNNGEGYSAELLFRWKHSAEESAKLRVYSSNPYGLYKQIYFSNLEVQYSTALTCSGLGEKNVLSCPSDGMLIKDAISKLMLAYKCGIIGKSGSGKSLLTYQIAKELHNQRWHVFKLNKHLVTDFTTIVAPCDKSLIVIDDSQVLSPHIIENILGYAHDKFMILFNWNSSVSAEDNFLFNYPNEKIIPEKQVSILKEFCLRNKKDIECKLNTISIDTNPRDYQSRIDYRIKLAAKEKTPWFFNYALTEGWRSTKNDMEILKNSNRLDLVLVVVAAYQYATLDNGVSVEVIIKALRNYNNSAEWLDKARKTISEYCFTSNGLIRNKHYEYSRKVLQIFTDEKVSTNEALFIIDVFRQILLNNQYESGHSNVLEFLLFDYKYCGYYLKNDGTITISTQNLFENSAEITRGKITKLNSLIRLSKDVLVILSQNQEILNGWILNCDRDYAYPLGNLINTLYNEKYNQLSVNQEMVDSIFEKFFSVSLKDKTGVTYLLNRINLFIDEKIRKYSSRKLLESNLVINISRKSPEEDCYNFTHIIYHLSCISPEWVSNCVESNIDSIVFLMNSNLIRSYHVFNELINMYFGVTAWVLDCYSREKSIDRIARTLAKRISVETVISAFDKIEVVEVQHLLSILYFIYMYDRKKIIDISEQINYKKLESLYKEDKVLVHDHSCMIRILYNPKCKTYLSYVSNLINNSSNICLLFIKILPELSLNKIKEGTPFKMDFRCGEEHNEILRLIRAIEEEYGKPLALHICQENIKVIKEDIYSKSMNVDNKKEKYDFLSYLHINYPDVLKQVFTDKEKVVTLLEKAYRLIKGKKQEKNIARLYVFLIDYYTRDFVENIEKIKRKYPSMKKFNI